MNRCWKVLLLSPLLLASVAWADPKAPGKLPDTVVERLIEVQVDGNFKNVPIQEAVAQIGQAIDVPVTLDGDAFKQAGWTKNMRVNLTLGSVSAEQAFAGIVGKYQDNRSQMVVCVDEAHKQLQITTREAAVAAKLFIYEFPKKTD